MIRKTVSDDGAAIMSITHRNGAFWGHFSYQSTLSCGEVNTGENGEGNKNRGGGSPLGQLSLASLCGR